MILYIENPKGHTRKLLELINGFSKVAGYKINIIKSSPFYTQTTTYQNEKLRKWSHLPSKKTKNKPRNKPTYGGERPALWIL